MDRAPSIYLCESGDDVRIQKSKRAKINGVSDRGGPKINAKSLERVKGGGLCLYERSVTGEEGVRI